MKNKITTLAMALVVLFGVSLTVTTAQSNAVNLLGGEVAEFNCEGNRLILERNSDTQVTANCRPHDNIPPPTDNASTFRYVRFVAESEIKGQPWASMAEFNVLDGKGVAIDRSGWSISADSEETNKEDGRAINAIDGNTNTIWHTEWSSGSPAHPHEIIIDMGSEYEVTGFRYLPRTAGINGMVKDYKFYVSNNGTTWEQAVAEGSFPSTKDEKTVSFTDDPAPAPTDALEPTPTSTPADIDPVEIKAHPYLLFGEEEVKLYREEITDPDNNRQELFKGLEDYLVEAEPASMLASAFANLLTQDNRQLEQAKALLLQEVSQECWAPAGEFCKRDGQAANKLRQVSLAYDWLSPYLSATEQHQVRDRIATEVCRYYEAFTYGTSNTAEQWGNWWQNNYTQNHFHSVMGGMMLGALAIKEDNPPVCLTSNKDGQLTSVTNQQILDYGLEKMERNYLIFNRIRDGSYPEGDSYVTAYSANYLPALWATNRLLNTPNLIQEERLEKFPLFFLYNGPPGQVWNRLTNYGDYYTSSRENDWFARDLHLSATVQHNPVANWIARQFYVDRYGESINLYSGNTLVAENLVLAFIFSDPSLIPQSPVEANLDLSYHAQDWEGVFMRSNWTDTAVAAALKVGPPGGHSIYNLARTNYNNLGQQEPTEFELASDHMHADANGLYLYANHTFLLPEMQGYLDSTPWGRYTSSHNTILVSDGQGRMRGQIQGDAEGGATLHPLWGQGSEYFWDIETPQSEVGIIEHASTGGYDYSLGQATSAYWPELGLTRYHRHVLFVREPGYLVVVDDLDAQSPKTYDWMGHSTGPVSQQEQWLKVEADNNQRLGVAMLSTNPEFIAASNEWEGIKLDNLYDFRYVSQKRSMYEWRIRQNCQRCRFINVLYPTDEQHWTQNPTITQLADTDQMAAVQIDFEAENRTDTLAVSFSPGQSLTAGDLTFDGRAVALEANGSDIQRALLVGGSQLRQGNIELIQNATSYIEVQYQDQQLVVRTPNPSGTTLFAPNISAVFWQHTDESNAITVIPLGFTREGQYITLNGAE